jgi:hypothetical protein
VVAPAANSGTKSLQNAYPSGTFSLLRCALAALLFLAATVQAYLIQTHRHEQSHIGQKAVALPAQTPTDGMTLTSHSGAASHSPAESEHFYCPLCCEALCAGTYLPPGARNLASSAHNFLEFLTADPASVAFQTTPSYMWQGRAPPIV